MIAALRRPGFVPALLALVFAAGLALAAPKFPPLTGRVVDGANVLSPAAEAQLTQELAALEAQTTRQMVVATVPDLQGYAIEDYGYQLGRHWGIGQKGEDNGVLLLVAPNDRQVRFEVGYGLEPVFTDTLAFLILDEKVLPKFRAGDIEAGVVDGTRAAIQQLALPENEAKARVAAVQARPRPQADGGGVPIMLIVFIVFIVLSMLGGIGRRRRRGGGGMWWLLPIILSSGGGGRSGGGWSGGGGGFSGGGGSFGGGGASGRW